MSLKINLIGVKISLHDKVFGMIGNEAILCRLYKKQGLDNLNFWHRGD